ncbi:hypothetical protein V5279_22540 [Bradyrhizobium sp. 26S5]|uniref:hypothetical protein n=1 Tax=Bradyrhizobium sp. 26S5 TaxID=3139729 RepID=UPI0030D30EF6
MTDPAIAALLNQFADTLNQAAATFDAIRHTIPSVDPGSPVARMVEQCERAESTMRQSVEPTRWQPPTAL